MAKIKKQRIDAVEPLSSGLLNRGHQLPTLGQKKNFNLDHFKVHHMAKIKK